MSTGFVPSGGYWPPPSFVRTSSIAAIELLHLQLDPRLLGFVLHLLDRRQKQRGEDADDGHHHQHLDERKTAARETGNGNRRFETRDWRLGICNLTDPWFAPSFLRSCRVNRSNVAPLPMDSGREQSPNENRAVCIFDSGLVSIYQHGRFRLLRYLPPLRLEIKEIRGMNKAITMKPTMPPRVMINSGSIRAVRLSVSTATSSSNVSATL